MYWSTPGSPMWRNRSSPGSRRSTTSQMPEASTTTSGRCPRSSWGNVVAPVAQSAKNCDVALEPVAATAGDRTAELAVVDDRALARPEADHFSSPNARLCATESPTTRTSATRSRGDHPAWAGRGALGQRRIAAATAGGDRRGAGGGVVSTELRQQPLADLDAGRGRDADAVGAHGSGRTRRRASVRIACREVDQPHAP